MVSRLADHGQSISHPVSHLLDDDISTLVLLSTSWNTHFFERRPRRECHDGLNAVLEGSSSELCDIPNGRRQRRTRHLLQTLNGAVHHSGVAHEVQLAPNLQALLILNQSYHSGGLPVSHGPWNVAHFPRCLIHVSTLSRFRFPSTSPTSLLPCRHPPHGDHGPHRRHMFGDCAIVTPLCRRVQTAVPTCKESAAFECRVHLAVVKSPLLSRGGQTGRPTPWRRENQLAYNVGGCPSGGRPFGTGG